jgi:hypothetical protein
MANALSVGVCLQALPLTLTSLINLTASGPLPCIINLKSYHKHLYNQFDEEPTKLAYLATKYKARHKWNHKDVIRLAHVKPKNNPIGFVIRYIIKNMEVYHKLPLSFSDR